MRKIIIALALIFSLTSFGQTNIQEMYGFDRNQMTTTLEHFNNDKYGSNFLK